LVAVMRQSLESLGRVATVETLSSEVLSQLPDAPDGDAARARRVADGLVRLALDRYQEHVLAETQAPLAKRRHGGRLALLAHNTALLDAAEAAADRADSLVSDAVRTGEPLVAQQRAARRVRQRYVEVFADSAVDAAAGEQPPPITDVRLLRLAAQTSRQVGLSTQGELH